MRCPKCGGKTKVFDVQYPYQGSYELRKRRHECLKCKYRFNTFQQYSDKKTKKNS